MGRGGKAPGMRSAYPGRSGYAGRATDRTVGVVAAVLVGGSEKAAAHRLACSHSTVKPHLGNARTKVGATTTAQLVWILAARLPVPEPVAPRLQAPTHPSLAAARSRLTGGKSFDSGDP